MEDKNNKTKIVADSTVAEGADVLMGLMRRPRIKKDDLEKIDIIVEDEDDGDG